MTSRSLEIRVGGKFRLKNKLASGSFGEVFIAENVQTKEDVAVKLEKTKTKFPQLLIEAKIIKTIGGELGFPALLYYGVEGDYNVMVTTLMGPSLEDLFQYCDKRFSLKTILMLADQMIERLQTLHSKNYLHRDIKPDNFLIGLDTRGSVVHLIDFGLSKLYKESGTNNHIACKKGKNLVGTARYASLNTHEGVE